MFLHCLSGYLRRCAQLRLLPLYEGFRQFSQLCIGQGPVPSDHLSATTPFRIGGPPKVEHRKWQTLIGHVFY